MYSHISTEPSQPIAVRGVARRFFCGLHSALSGSLHPLSQDCHWRQKWFLQRTFMVAIACYLYICNWWRLLSTELEEASRDSFVVQDLDVDTLRLMLDYLYLGNIKWMWNLFFFNWVNHFLEWSLIIDWPRPFYQGLTNTLDICLMWLWLLQERFVTTWRRWELSRYTP